MTTIKLNINDTVTEMPSAAHSHLRKMRRREIRKVMFKHFVKGIPPSKQKTEFILRYLIVQKK